MPEEIKVGDRVRSFDFADGKFGRDLEGERACYMEGVVKEIQQFGPCRHYIIWVERQVFGGEEVPVGFREATPPVNGTPKSFGGVCDGVEKIEEV